MTAKRRPEYCCGCHFARAVSGADNEGLFTCHRYAPRPVPDEERARVFLAWPAVVDSDWCGEYKAALDDPQ